MKNRGEVSTEGGRKGGEDCGGGGGRERERERGVEGAKVVTMGVGVQGGTKVRTQ
jgi:hypothetical protein